MAACTDSSPAFVWPPPPAPESRPNGDAAPPHHPREGSAAPPREPLGPRRSRQRTPPQTPEKHKRHKKQSAHAVSPLTSPDRFMPQAAAQNEEERLWQQMDEEPSTLHAADQEYSQRLRTSLSPFKQPAAAARGGRPGSGGGSAPRDHHRAMTFGNDHRASPDADAMGELRQQFRDSQGLQARAAVHRQISHTPERILDAPGLRDDFYLNLLDWSPQNTLAVGLGRTVYLWHATSQTVATLMQTSVEGDYIASVKFNADGSRLAVGTATAEVRLFDMEAGGAKLGELTGHSDRVSSLAWNAHGQLTTAGRDASVLTHDLRAGPGQFERLKAHTKEVCGLDWSCDSRSLASGGNDNLLCVWDARKSASANANAAAAAPRLKFTQHSAAVKALAWHPRRKGLLASGGGTHDCTLRLWDTERAVCKRAVETGSQVASVVWNRQGTELVTSHGYSHNQLALWTYPKLQRVAELTGHHARALHLALAPDGATVVSGSADETLRFWKLFEPPSRGAGRVSSLAAGKGAFLGAGGGAGGDAGRGGAGSAKRAGGAATRKMVTTISQPTIR
jgi:cell division cycle protein 20 (cofactor of APC complex)